MSNTILEGLEYLNNINNIIAVYEPLFDNKKETYNFSVKFLNDCFKKEFKSDSLIDNRVDVISTRLQNFLLDSLIKFQGGYNTITIDVHMNDILYKVNFCKFGGIYVLCTFYQNEEVLISEGVSSIGKNFIENSLDIIICVDSNGRILYGNKMAVKTYGYTYNELLNLSVFDLRNQDVNELTQKQLNDALKRGIKFKTYHFKKDGYKFPVEVRSVYSCKESKNMVVSIIRDITDEEDILKDAIIFLRTLDIFEDEIIVLNNEFKVSHWSKGAEEKTGYKYDEIIGKDIEILVPDNKINEFRDNINNVKKGNIVKNVETVRIYKNGNINDVSISISPIYDFNGFFIGAVGIYKDISEKKELAKRLQEYEKKSRLALEGGQFGIWDLNICTQELFHFNNWKKILGYNENEIKDCYNSWENLIHPDDLPDVLNKHKKHFEGEDYIVEYRIRCKNSKYKWIRTKGRIIEWIDGKPLRIVGTNEDITDRKLIELELKEKYKQLELLKEEAINTSKAKSQFLANMSHEIRTPMNGILAAIQLIQLGDLNVEQNKYIKILKESIDNLLAIINNLLDISKIESGQFKINSEPFNLKETINNIYNNLLITGNSKGLEISYYLDSNIEFEVIGDELRLKEIITNLINNAIKFTEVGYVSFRVKMISSNDNSQKIEFRVKDSGIGIEDSFKEKIFSNFSQGDLSTRKKYMGTGLGLSISKQLATLMNGDISFESIVGQGSTFCFTCEFEKSNKKNSDIGKNNIIEEKNKINNSEQNVVILCVEDNLINQEVIESIMKRKGYRYIAAYNGNEALDILKNNKVDLILMDVQMPGLNGFQTTKIIRDGELDGKHIPIIAMTAYAMLEDKEKCIQALMDDYIVKPFNIEKLYEIVEFYLRK